jgi:hypothetical protein
VERFAQLAHDWASSVVHRSLIEVRAISLAAPSVTVCWTILFWIAATEMQELVHRICLSSCQSGTAPPARSEINMIEFTGLITLEVCIITAFPHFDLSNFPVLNYKKDTGDKDAVHDPMDSKQWGAGGQERSCPMASRGSWRRMYDIMFLSRCD